MAEYTREYSDNVSEELSSDDFSLPVFSFDVDPEFRMPPVLDVIRFINNFNDPDSQEKNARYCILGKTVRLKIDGEQVGTGFTFTDIDAPWDLFPEIVKNPLCLRLLFELAGAYVLKNSMPSQKRSPLTMAKQGTKNTIE